MQKPDDDGAAATLEEDMSKLDLVDDMITMVDTLNESAAEESKADAEAGEGDVTLQEKQLSVEADIVDALIPDVEGTLVPYYG